MNIRGINQDTLRLLIRMGEESHPREFAALLTGEKGVITGINLIPGTVTGYQSASVFFDMVPLNFGVIGSAHSHPNGIISPSDADIEFFSRCGDCHIIIGYPYEEGSWRCFYPNGENRPLEVIQ